MLLQGKHLHCRISKDLPKGNLDISRIFRQAEQSLESNLLDSLSKSLLKARSPRPLNEENMLASHLLSSTPLYDEDCLLLNNDDGVDPEDLLLNHNQGNEDSMILNLLDDPMNEGFDED